MANTLQRHGRQHPPSTVPGEVWQLDKHNLGSIPHKLLVCSGAQRERVLCMHAQHASHLGPSVSQDVGFI